jgi:hypothetical protein
MSATTPGWTRRLLGMRVNFLRSRHHEWQAYCNPCEMDREFCEHGLADRRRTAAASASRLLITPNGIAHFAGWPNKGDHEDYSRWAELNRPRAWERLGNGEQLRATGWQSSGLMATDRCKDCVSHCPW